MRLIRDVYVCEYWSASAILLGNVSTLHWAGLVIQIVYFEKIRVFKAGLCCEYISME